MRYPAAEKLDCGRPQCKGHQHATRVGQSAPRQISEQLARTGVNCASQSRRGITPALTVPSSRPTA